MNNTDNQSFGQDYQAPERAPNLALDLAIIQSATNSYRGRIIDAEHAITNVHLENKKLREQLNEQKPNVNSTNHILGHQLRVAQQQIIELQQKLEEQQTLLADWMVSQKAFKELAIQLGAEKGLDPNEVIEMGLDKEIDVLENKNESSNKTNFNDSSHSEEIKDSLIAKYHKDKVLRQSRKIRDESLPSNTKNKLKGNT